MVREVRKRVQQPDAEKSIRDLRVPLLRVAADALPDVDERAVHEEVERPDQRTGGLPLHLQILEWIREHPPARDTRAVLRT